MITTAQQKEGERIGKLMRTHKRGKYIFPESSEWNAKLLVTDYWYPRDDNKEPT